MTKVQVGDYLLIDDKEFPSGKRWLHFRQVDYSSATETAHIDPPGVGVSFPSMKARKYGAKKRADSLRIASSVLPLTWVRIPPTEINEKMKWYDSEVARLKKEKEAYAAQASKSVDLYDLPIPELRDFMFTWNSDLKAYECNECHRPLSKEHEEDMNSHLKFHQRGTA